MATLRKTVFNDSNLTLFQSAIEDAINELSNIAISNGNLITGVSLKTGSTNSVNHKLGRKARGYIVVSKSANATIWNGSMNDQTIALETSANCTVDLWVF